MFITYHIVLRLTDSRIAITKLTINTTEIVVSIDLPTYISNALILGSICSGNKIFGS